MAGKLAYYLKKLYLCCHNPVYLLKLFCHKHLTVQTWFIYFYMNFQPSNCVSDHSSQSVSLKRPGPSGRRICTSLTCEAVQNDKELLAVLP